MTTYSSGAKLNLWGDFGSITPVPWSFSSGFASTSGAKLNLWGDFGSITPTPWAETSSQAVANFSRVYANDNATTRVTIYSATSQYSLQAPTDVGVTLTQFVQLSGNYKIVGEVQVNTVNSAGKWVYLFPAVAPSLCIGAQFTTSTGAFTFNNLALGKYLVFAVDPVYTYNGKLFDNITPVHM